MSILTIMQKLILMLGKLVEHVQIIKDRNLNLKAGFTLVLQKSRVLQLQDAYLYQYDKTCDPALRGRPRVKL